MCCLACYQNKGHSLNEETKLEILIDIAWQEILKHRLTYPPPVPPSLNSAPEGYATIFIPTSNDTIYYGVFVDSSIINLNQELLSTTLYKKVFYNTIVMFFHNESNSWEWDKMAQKYNYSHLRSFSINAIAPIEKNRTIIDYNFSCAALCGHRSRAYISNILNRWTIDSTETISIF
jgi:hypothetical protein